MSDSWHDDGITNRVSAPRTATEEQQQQQAFLFVLYHLRYYNVVICETMRGSSHGTFATFPRCVSRGQLMAHYPAALN